jgi:hypothetical protein
MNAKKNKLARMRKRERERERKGNVSLFDEEPLFFAYA